MILPERIWNSPAIRTRLYQEAAFECPKYGKSFKPFYWMSVPEGDSKRGNVHIGNFKESVIDPSPHEEQIDFAIKIREKLQKEESYDGVWIVGWTHPPVSGGIILGESDNVWGRLLMLWLDEDADIQFPVESNFPVALMIQERGVDYYVDLAAAAYRKWNGEYGKLALKEDFGIKESEMTKESLSTLN